MKGKLKLAIVGSLIFIVAIILIIGNYFYSQSVQRGTEVELHKEKAVEEVIAKPASRELYYAAREWYAMQNPQELTLITYDKLELAANFIKNPANKNKSVILVHGFRKTKEDMSNYAKFYYELGYDILMPDLRGHGDSEGKYYGFGWHDRLDMMEWINLLMEDAGSDSIVLHGNSAGAATVLMTSGEELPEAVKAIIADSSYSTMKEELAHQLKHIYGLPSFPLLEITSVITKVRAGYFFGEASVIKQVEKNKLPLFIIHGEADDLVPTWMGEEIFNAANGYKELWLIPKVGHIEAYELETSEFQVRLRDFLTHIE